MRHNGNSTFASDGAGALAAGSLPPLVVHVIYRLAVGGLENSLVNLINRMPAERYRHAIVCVDDYTDFRERIRKPNVPIIAIHKHDGQDLPAWWRFQRALRQLRPDILHTRAFGTLEGQVYAALVRVRGRVHGEHGRSIEDLNGLCFKRKLLRRVVQPLVHHYTAVSRDLADWLVRTQGVAGHRVTHIYNGVDTDRFHPRAGPRGDLGPEGFAPADAFVVGTVGRMQPIKDQPTLLRAFLHLLDAVPDARKRLRLVLIGDGPLRDQCRELLEAKGAGHLVWLPGERADVPELLRAMDVFVLPSLGEGTSNTILEAMASGLPVVATRVGGNPELVEDARTGALTPPADPIAMASAIRPYLEDAGRVASHGEAGRNKALAQFSLAAMVNGYMSVYDAVLNRKRS